MSAAGSIRIYQTTEHACGYWPERRARDIVLDPDSRVLPAVYPAALAQGFRRSGGHVYRPQCASCMACVPVRIDVAAFLPNRSQRRCLQRNADLRLADSPPERSEAVFALYQRYLRSRHAKGGMDEPRPEDFDGFLSAPWSPTRFLRFQLDDGRLLGVAVCDLLPNGLSAVYTFFEPEERSRGLGTWAILKQVEWARQLGLPHVYLGFWLQGHPKMDYKRRFSGLEQLRHGDWETLTTDRV
ncbi:MAG: arginyltransferase [Lysobacterales bacterium]|jgi:arginine-tRNA-protein transferase